MHCKIALLAVLAAAAGALAHTAQDGILSERGQVGPFDQIRSARLVARQAVAVNGGMPARCSGDCAAFNTLASRCSSGSEAQQYTCVCTSATFEQLITCGLCAPDYYDFYDGGLRGFVDNALNECRKVGHAVDVDTASLPGDDSSSGSSAASSASTSSSSTSSTARATSRITSAAVTAATSAGPRQAANNVVAAPTTATSGTFMGPMNSAAGTRSTLVSTGVVCVSAAFVAMLLQSKL